MAGKAWKQIAKDYIAYPALAGPAAGALAAARRRDPLLGFMRGYRSALKANATSNVVRNV